MNHKAMIRVNCGSAWHYDAWSVRAAKRDVWFAEGINTDLGFRLVSVP